MVPSPLNWRWLIASFPYWIGILANACVCFARRVNSREVEAVALLEHTV